MERREVVSRLGTTTRVVIVRPRFRRAGLVSMRLQVRRRRRGWRTLGTVRVPAQQATREQATAWMWDYEEYPSGRIPGPPKRTRGHHD